MLHERQELIDRGAEVAAAPEPEGEQAFPLFGQLWMLSAQRFWRVAERRLQLIAGGAMDERGVGLGSPADVVAEPLRGGPARGVQEDHLADVALGGLRRGPLPRSKRLSRPACREEQDARPVLRRTHLEGMEREPLTRGPFQLSDPRLNDSRGHVSRCDRRGVDDVVDPGSDRVPFPDQPGGDGVSDDQGRLGRHQQPSPALISSDCSSELAGNP